MRFRGVCSLGCDVPSGAASEEPDEDTQQQENSKTARALVTLERRLEEKRVWGQVVLLYPFYDSRCRLVNQKHERMPFPYTGAAITRIKGTQPER